MGGYTTDKGGTTRKCKGHQHFDMWEAEQKQWLLSPVQLTLFPRAQGRIIGREKGVLFCPAMEKLHLMDSLPTCYQYLGQILLVP